MTKIWYVIQREYLQIVKTKGFIIGTVLGPVLMLALLIVPILASLAAGGEQRTFGVVDRTGELFPALVQRLDYKLKDGRPRYVLKPFAPAAGQGLEALRQDLRREVLAKQLSGYIYLPSDVTRGGSAELLSEHVSDFEEIRRINEALNSVVVEKRLEQEGLDPKLIAQSTQHVDLKTIKLTEKGQEEDTGGTFAVAYLLVLILYMSMFFYGAIIMRGVIEEKNNRVVDIVLSSLKPSQLMAGKLLGIAAVGFTQYLIWAVFGLGLSNFGGGLLSSLIPAASSFKIPHIPLYIFVYFVVFFILGYFLYATIYAAVGSTVNSEKEAQQLLMPISMTLVVPILLLTFVLRSPNSSLSVVLSLIPFFAPILMLMRICVLLPPFSQIALSIGLLLVAITAMVWFSAKIYRVGILMYGKKPSLSEIARWVRYK
jgi:ABC-2 type transport system permease protein